MVSPPVSDETYIPIKLSEFSSASTSSQSACHYVSNDNDNVINEEHEECSYVQSILENTQSISMENEINSNNGEVYLEVSDFSTLENVVRKEFSAINREINALSSKMDICLMNQEKLNRFLLPGEKVIKKPSNFPSLPVNTKVQLNCLENFLRDDGNLSATSIYFSKYVDPGSLDNSVRKILSKILTNTLAQNFSFQGRGNKQKFETLKIWDLVQGALLQSFEGEALTTAEKVAGSWLANAKWRQQSDGTSLRRKLPKE